MQIFKRILLAPAIFQDWAKTVGWRAAFSFFIYRAQAALSGEAPATLTIKPRKAMYPLVARGSGSSDLEVFHQIFQFDEYACIRDISPARVILDLGANVGYSSAYLLSCFRGAKVVAVEPDPANFKICSKNLAPYGNRAQVVPGAVWSKKCELVLSRGTFGDGREWASQVHESDGKGAQPTVEAWDVPSLMRLAGSDYVDLLKIDIEGSELELFGNNSSLWLPKVRNICIELHGDDCTAMFLNALKEFDYDLGVSGELTICRNIQLKQASRGYRAGG